MKSEHFVNDLMRVLKEINLKHLTNVYDDICIAHRIKEIHIYSNILPEHCESDSSCNI